MVTTPRRKALLQMAGGDQRLARSLELLFQNTGTATVSDLGAVLAIVADAKVRDGEASDQVPVAAPVASMELLADVVADAPAEGDGLWWNDTDNEWQSGAGPSTGATGSFSTADAKTVTVTDGIITSIV